ncbi:MAG: aminoacyl-tRNA hydrolase [Deltaproteobacteria bacterium RIFOXYD12_FULL_57_12]|nr:MAG: aminoacyl-tRNA hydrolase [Deltaproteobacteria bacterium RIFOXYD12_FULL_57_12]
MFLLVGLGNPGRQYVETRHNIGFAVLDYLAGRHGLTLEQSRWHGAFVKAALWGETISLLRPETYMNLSGKAVAAVVGFYKLPAARVMVIHDDLDLPFGRIKLAAKGGAGGHNGIRSIIDNLGTDEFSRLKIGIGRPDHVVPAERYVLSCFSPEEQLTLTEKMPLIEDGLRLFISDGIAAAMNFMNGAR